MGCRYNEGSNRKILVNGAACLQGISMHPPVNQDGKVRRMVRCAGHNIPNSEDFVASACFPNTVVVFHSHTPIPIPSLPTRALFLQSFASASYSLAKKFERLVGSVAINDDVAPEKLREGGSPVSVIVQLKHLGRRGGV
jgi:hypothetical protein